MNIHQGTAVDWGKTEDLGSGWSHIVNSAVLPPMATWVWVMMMRDEGFELPSRIHKVGDHPRNDDIFTHKR
jgi:hypothetical protein